MKKIFNISCFVILSLIFFTFDVNAMDYGYNLFDRYDYYFENYHVDIVVNENNTLQITEKIGAYFNVSKHGIFRKIPLTNDVERLDGIVERNRVRISNIDVNEEYSLSNEGNYKVIKIGSPNYTLTGEKDYVISYLYDLGKDKTKNYDELYFNIIGTEWDTVIDNVTFTITMPKDFDESKIGFSSGSYGSANYENVEYYVDGNVITGSLDGSLDAYEGLNIRLELPDGYFIVENLRLDFLTVLMFVVPLLSLIIGFILWFKYGKDNEVIETVEFYPPNGFNSLEVAFLYKGKAESNDITSLLVYLANKGYIKISEIEEKNLFMKSKTFQITKIKEYDGNNVNEREFFDGLFKTGNIVTESDLSNKFYRTINIIKANINNKKNKDLLFVKNFINMRIPIILMIMVTLVTIISIPTYEYSGMSDVFSTLFLCLFYTPFYAVGIFTSMPILFRIFWLGFTILHSIGMFSTLSIGIALVDNTYYLLAFVLGIVSIIALIIVFKVMPKRTQYGNEMLGKVKGFKNFLETAEKDKLELMVMNNPTYFYDILPYTYVLGVSSKWIEKFESISLQAPDWYDSSSSFTVSSFGTFMNTTMTSAGRAMSSTPSSSSGGSSGGSGGGFSGGGSGGGGGGSW